MNHNLSIIIFGKNTGNDVLCTIASVEAACSSILENYELIVVDDGSQTPLDEATYRSISKKISRIIYIPKSIGISGAILRAAESCKFNNVLPIPGHDMFSKQAILNVISLMGQGRLIIGCRNNLSEERPLVKKIASRILRDLYRHLTFYFVGDIHGLILYQKEDLLRFLIENGRHSNAIRVVTPILAEGGLLIQTMAPINKGHDNRSSRRLSDSFPSLRNVLVTINALVWSRRLYSNEIK